MTIIHSRRHQIWQLCCMEDYTISEISAVMIICYSSAAQIVRSLCDGGHMIQIEKTGKNMHKYRAVQNDPPQQHAWHKHSEFDITALANPDNYLICMRVLFPQATKENKNAS